MNLIKLLKKEYKLLTDLDILQFNIDHDVKNFENEEYFKIENKLKKVKKKIIKALENELKYRTVNNKFN